MPELDKEEILDPVVLAAMVEDPDEDEDTKELRKEILGSDETVKAEDVETNEDKDDDDEDDEEKLAKKPTSDDEDDEEDDPVKKPLEAKDDETDEDDEPKQTRKERRQERSKSFIDEIRKDNTRGSRNPTKIPEYKPVDYKTAPEEGFNADELAEDRERHGATQFVKGAETVRYWADQDKFWGDLTNEAKITSYDPKLNFLVEETPDGKKNPNFDPDKTAEINEMYFQLIGLKQFHKTNDQGQPLYDRATNLPLITSTVDRTDLSYEKFARKYVNNMSKWNDEDTDNKIEETRKNITSQRKHQGVRPGGKSRKSLGAIKPGDITRMSEEQLEKNEAEIERQILEML